jgi:hypothetical protein
MTQKAYSSSLKLAMTTTSMRMADEHIYNLPWETPSHIHEQLNSASTRSNAGVCAGRTNSVRAVQ